MQLSVLARTKKIKPEYTESEKTVGSIGSIVQKQEIAPLLKESSNAEFARKHFGHISVKTPYSGKELPYIEHSLHALEDLAYMDTIELSSQEPFTETVLQGYETLSDIEKKILSNEFCEWLIWQGNISSLIGAQFASSVFFKKAGDILLQKFKDYDAKEVYLKSLSKKIGYADRSNLIKSMIAFYEKYKDSDYTKSLVIAEGKAVTSESLIDDIENITNPIESVRTESEKEPETGLEKIFMGAAKTVKNAIVGEEKKEIKEENKNLCLELKDEFSKNPLINGLYCTLYSLGLKYKRNPEEGKSDLKDTVTFIGSIIDKCKEVKELKIIISEMEDGIKSTKSLKSKKEYSIANEMNEQRSLEKEINARQFRKHLDLTETTLDELAHTSFSLDEMYSSLKTKLKHEKWMDEYTLIEILEGFKLATPDTFPMLKGRIEHIKANALTEEFNLAKDTFASRGEMTYTLVRDIIETFIRGYESYLLGAERLKTELETSDNESEENKIKITLFNYNLYELCTDLASATETFSSEIEYIGSKGKFFSSKESFNTWRKLTDPKEIYAQAIKRLQMIPTFIKPTFDPSSSLDQKILKIISEKELRIKKAEENRKKYETKKGLLSKLFG